MTPNGEPTLAPTSVATVWKMPLPEGAQIPAGAQLVVVVVGPPDGVVVVVVTDPPSAGGCVVRPPNPSVAPRLPDALVAFQLMPSSRPAVRSTSKNRTLSSTCCGDATRMA